MRIGMWWCALLGKNTHKLRNDAGTMAIKYVILIKILMMLLPYTKLFSTHQLALYPPLKQQTILSVHIMREHSFRERTAIMNRIRALPFEFGLIINIELFIDYNSLFFFWGLKHFPSPSTLCLQ